jgi:chromosome partitioning protein
MNLEVYGGNAYPYDYKNDFRRPTVISLLSEKGGVGKTTLAIHLATYFSFRNRVMVFDADPRETIVDWATHSKERKFNFTFTTENDPKNLQLLLAGKLPLLNQFDYVFFDTPGTYDHPLVSGVALVSDLVILPSSGSGPDLFAVNRGMQRFLRPRGINVKVVLSQVIAGTVPSARKHQDIIRQNFEVPVYNTMIRQFQVNRNVSVDYKAMTVFDLGAEAAGAQYDYTELAEEVKDDLRRINRYRPERDDEGEIDE